MAFEDFSTGELHDIVSTIMRYKFNDGVSEGSFIEAINKLLAKIRDEAQTRSEDDERRKFILGILDRTATESDIKPILDAIEYTCRHSFIWETDNLEEWFDTAIWPFHINPAQRADVRKRLEKITKDTRAE